MISATIQTVLQQICNSFSPVVNSDTLPATPFCVHEEKVSSPLRDKEGIYGFDYDLTVVVVGDTDSQVDPIVESIIETIEMLSNSTIDQASFESSTGLQYDNENKRFHNQLNFKLLTNNL